MDVITAFGVWLLSVWNALFGLVIPSMNVQFKNLYLAILLFVALVTFIDFIKKGGKF